MTQITTVNKVISDYFVLNEEKDIIPAKVIMPDLIKAGVFFKDKKNGQPLRQLLRKLDDAGELDKIPSLHVVRKEESNFWYFKRHGYEPTDLEVDRIPPKEKTKKELKRREVNEEQYVIDLCDKVLELKALRHHKFDYLIGDLHRNGKTRSRIPCDAYYPTLKLVVEFNGFPHTKESKARKEKSELYAERKQKVLTEHKIQLIDLDYSVFQTNELNQLTRDEVKDLSKLSEMLDKYLTDKA